MNAELWLEDLETLCTRFACFGIGADIAALSTIEAWSLYRFLLRLADG